MKINIISDIHATINEKTEKIEYNLPLRYSHKKYTEAVNSLYDYWMGLDHRDDVQMYYGDMLEPFEEYHYLKTPKDITDFISRLKNLVETGFDGMDYSSCLDISRKLTNLRETLNHNHMKWNTKNKVSINDLSDYVFKSKFDFDPGRLKHADYLIIAGDLGLDNYYDEVLKDIEEKTSGKFKKVLHIAGNHDHWWIGYKHCNKKKPDSVNLSHDYCEHVDGDYVFLGCTMWTPISDYDMWSVGRYMNDYRYTPNFSPFNSDNQFKIQSKWLKDRIEQYKGKKIVIFTHHQPFEELIADDYKHSDVNAAYAVLDHSLDDINKNGDIKLWCCGHTHHCYDGVLHDIHVVRNPIGYRDHYGFLPPENPSDSWYNKIIEV